MDLILWRHAEAEDADGVLPDHKRRLTARGAKQAQQVARWLGPNLPRKLKILVSPAERTRQTAHALELAYAIEPRLGLAASAQEVLAVAGWPEHNGAVLIVGHQPSLGRMASLLLAGQEADWSIKKGALWWLTNRVRRGDTQTVLRAMIPVELLD